MKKRILILSILLSSQFLVYGQNFSDSKEFKLTKYDSALVEKMFLPNGEFNGVTSIFVTNNNGNQLKEIEVSIESYDNDSKVEEFVTTDFENLRKIIRVVIKHCACYCDTSKYYWFVTNNNSLIKLPTIEQEDYEFEMKTLDYVFNSESNSIDLIEFQDEMINKNEKPIFKLKSKNLLKSYQWNGKELSTK